MVLREAPVYRNSQARRNLLSTQSLPHVLARLYDHTSPFTSADLGDSPGPSSKRYRSGLIHMAQNRSLRLDQGVAKHTHCPTSCLRPKGFSMDPVIALIGSMLFAWITLMWASCMALIDQQRVRDCHRCAPHTVREDLLSHLCAPTPRWRTLWTVNVAGE